jgi:hypothetical protein
VSLNPLVVAYEKLEVPNHDPFLGMLVHGSDNRLVRRLPDRSILTAGNPLTPLTHGVYGVDSGGSLTQLLGQLPYNVALTLEVAQGLTRPDWMDVEAVPEDRTRIHEFRVRALEIGNRAKVDERWCGTYETAMSAVGIDSTLTEAVETLTPEQVADLPAGTVLRFREDETSVLLRRDDAADNPAKTVRIGGTVPGEWASRDLVVVHPHDATDRNMGIKVVSHAEMESMPVGTSIGEANGSRQWTKNTEGTWASSGGYGSHRSNAFSLGNLRYTHLPSGGVS